MESSVSCPNDSQSAYRRLNLLREGTVVAWRTDLTVMVIGHLRMGMGPGPLSQLLDDSLLLTRTRSVSIWHCGKILPSWIRVRCLDSSKVLTSSPS